MYAKLNESGRSMVEMLGVLAVIGVLSVGGVMGYKYGMMKYRVNETINELNILANTFGIQMQQMTDERTILTEGELLSEENMEPVFVIQDIQANPMKQKKMQIVA